MSRLRLATVVIAMSALAVVTHGRESGFGTDRSVSYADFMRLDAQERLNAFRTLSAENKAILKRTHAERWLRANRANLNSRQIELVQRAIAFITPQLYQDPPAPDSRKKNDDLKTELTCSLGRQRVTAAFTFLVENGTQTWVETIDEWLTWFSECPGRTRGSRN